MRSKEDFLADPEFVRWVRRPTPELETYWSNWIAANPESLQAFRTAKELLAAVRYQEPEVPLGKKRELLAKILKDAPTVVRKEETVNEPSRRTDWGIWSRVAAILVFGFLTGWLLKDRIFGEERTAVAPEAVMLTRATNPGEKLQLTLEDGTRIWLNSSSSLRYPAHFDKSSRQVYLEGEAYFEVSADSLRPFSVHAGGMTTIVLGTSFNVSTKDRVWNQVSLVEGKLKVSNRQFETPVWLQAGEMVRYDNARGVQEKNQFDVRGVTGWRNGLILFKKASRDDVLSKLEEWYGVDIELNGDKNQEWSVTAEYTNETLENVLTSLAYVHKFSFQINRNKITINL